MNVLWPWSLIFTASNFFNEQSFQRGFLRGTKLPMVLSFRFRNKYLKTPILIQGNSLFVAVLMDPQRDRNGPQLNLIIIFCSGDHRYRRMQIWVVPLTIICKSVVGIVGFGWAMGGIASNFGMNTASFFPTSINCSKLRRTITSSPSNVDGDHMCKSITLRNNQERFTICGAKITWYHCAPKEVKYMKGCL